MSPEERDLRNLDAPLGLGTPQDVAGAVRYLASPAARWVTVTLLDINGGGRRSIHEIQGLDRS